MSEIQINEKEEKGFIRDVIFAYVKIQTPVKKWGSDTEKEYTVDCVVDKATAKAYKKAFPKNGFTEVPTSEFEDKFKMKPLFPDEDEQYVIKLKAGAQFKGDFKEFKIGDLLPYEFKGRPKVYVPEGDGVRDVTMELLVGNASKGDVSFSINTNTYGSFPQLTAILVKDLIEYKSSGPSTDFGKVVGGSKKSEEAVPQKEAGGSFDTDDGEPF